MNIAILVVSSASLVCSAGCLAIMLKGAKKAEEVATEVEKVKAKVGRNATILKSALSQMEL